MRENLMREKKGRKKALEEIEKKENRKEKK